MKPTIPMLLIMLTLTAACDPIGARNAGADPSAKIELDLAALDEHGLRGPADGKVSMAYEFAIPDTAECRAQVQAIDPTVQFYSGSRGRIGAGEDECLCIGETYQPDYAQVLYRLAELPFIDRIAPCYFE